MLPGELEEGWQPVLMPLLGGYGAAKGCAQWAGSAWPGTVGQGTGGKRVLWDLVMGLSWALQDAKCRWQAMEANSVKAFVQNGVCLVD